MLFKAKKTNTSIDQHQKLLFEHAQERIKEKKELYTHFIFFIVGCLFMVVINLLLGFGKNFKPLGQYWFIYGILIWSFFILAHTIRVLFFSTFMNKAWQAQQMDYLVAKQQKKIEEMEQKLNLKIPKENLSTKTTLLDHTKDSSTPSET